MSGLWQRFDLDILRWRDIETEVSLISKSAFVGFFGLGLMIA